MYTFFRLYSSWCRWPNQIHVCLNNMYSWYSVDWKLFPHLCQGKFHWQLAGHRPYSNLIVPASSLLFSHSAPDPSCWAKFVSSWFEARALQKASVDSWRVKVPVDKNGWCSMSPMDEHIQACHTIDCVWLHSALMGTACGFFATGKNEKEKWKDGDSTCRDTASWPATLSLPPITGWVGIDRWSFEHWKEVDCARERGVHLQCHPRILTICISCITVFDGIWGFPWIGRPESCSGLGTIILHTLGCYVYDLPAMWCDRDEFLTSFDLHTFAL